MKAKILILILILKISFNFGLLSKNRRFYDYQNKYGGYKNKNYNQNFIDQRSSNMRGIQRELDMYELAYQRYKEATGDRSSKENNYMGSKKDYSATESKSQEYPSIENYYPYKHEKIDLDGRRANGLEPKGFWSGEKSMSRDKGVKLKMYVNDTKIDLMRNKENIYSDKLDKNYLKETRNDVTELPKRYKVQDTLKMRRKDVVSRESVETHGAREKYKLSNYEKEKRDHKINRIDKIRSEINNIEENNEKRYNRRRYDNDETYKRINSEKESQEKFYSKEFRKSKSKRYKSRNSETSVEWNQSTHNRKKYEEIDRKLFSTDDKDRKDRENYDNAKIGVTKREYKKKDRVASIEFTDKKRRDAMSEENERYVHEEDVYTSKTKRPDATHSKHKKDNDVIVRRRNDSAESFQTNYKKVKHLNRRFDQADAYKRIPEVARPRKVKSFSVERFEKSQTPDDGDRENDYHNPDVLPPDVPHRKLKPIHAPKKKRIEEPIQQREVEAMDVGTIKSQERDVYRKPEPVQTTREYYREENKNNENTREINKADMPQITKSRYEQYLQHFHDNPNGNANNNDNKDYVNKQFNVDERTTKSFDENRYGNRDVKVEDKNDYNRGNQDNTNNDIYYKGNDKAYDNNRERINNNIQSKDYDEKGKYGKKDNYDNSNSRFNTNYKPDGYMNKNNYDNTQNYRTEYDRNIENKKEFINYDQTTTFPKYSVSVNENYQNRDNYKNADNNENYQRNKVDYSPNNNANNYYEEKRNSPNYREAQKQDDRERYESRPNLATLQEDRYNEPPKPITEVLDNTRAPYRDYDRPTFEGNYPEITQVTPSVDQDNPNDKNNNYNNNDNENNVVRSGKIRTEEKPAYNVQYLDFRRSNRNHNTRENLDLSDNEIKDWFSANHDSNRTKGKISKDLIRQWRKEVSHFENERNENEGKAIESKKKRKAVRKKELNIDIIGPREIAYLKEKYSKHLSDVERSASLSSTETEDDSESADDRLKKNDVFASKRDRKRKLKDDFRRNTKHENKNINKVVSDEQVEMTKNNRRLYQKENLLEKEISNEITNNNLENEELVHKNITSSNFATHVWNALEKSIIARYSTNKTDKMFLNFALSDKYKHASNNDPTKDKKRDTRQEIINKQKDPVRRSHIATESLNSADKSPETEVNITDDSWQMIDPVKNDTDKPRSPLIAEFKSQSKHKKSKTKKQEAKRALASKFENFYRNYHNHSISKHKFYKNKNKHKHKGHHKKYDKNQINSKNNNYDDNDSMIKQPEIKDKSNETPRKSNINKEINDHQSTINIESLKLSGKKPVHKNKIVNTDENIGNDKNIESNKKKTNTKHVKIIKTDTKFPINETEYVLQKIDNIQKVITESNIKQERITKSVQSEPNVFGFKYVNSTLKPIKFRAENTPDVRSDDQINEEEDKKANRKKFAFIVVLIQHLEKEIKSLCTAVTITPNFAITSAHCIPINQTNLYLKYENITRATSWSSCNNTRDKTKRNSDTDLPRRNKAKVAGVFIHPNYRQSYTKNNFGEKAKIINFNDIALVKTEGSLPLPAGKLSALEFDALLGYEMIYYGKEKSTEHFSRNYHSNQDYKLLSHNGILNSCNFKTDTTLLCLAVKCKEKGKKDLMMEGGPVIFADRIVGIVTEVEPAVTFIPVSSYLEWISQVLDQEASPEKTERFTQRQQENVFNLREVGFGRNTRAD